MYPAIDSIANQNINGAKYNRPIPYLPYLTLLEHEMCIYFYADAFYETLHGIYYHLCYY